MILYYENITQHTRSFIHSLVFVVYYISSSRINDECLMNDGVKMLTMTFVVVFLSIQLCLMCTYMNVDVYARSTTKQNQSLTTVAAVFYVVRQNEQTKKREIKELDRQRQTSNMKRRFDIRPDSYSKDTNIE